MSGCSDLGLTTEDRLEYVLGQMWGRSMPSSVGLDDPFALPELLDFQREFLEEVLSPTGPDIIGVWGGIGCGKSVILSLAAWVVAVTRPGSVSLMSSDTFTNMHAITKFICDKVFGDDATWVGPPASEYRFKNGSIVMLRAYQLPKTHDESKNPWEGRTIDGLLIVDEVQKLPPKCADHAEERTRGISVDAIGQRYYPKVILNGRPGAIDWWPKLVEARGGLVFRPKTRDNPHNGPRYLAKLKASRSEREFLCLTEGAPMPVKGAVYGVFEDAPWPAGNVLTGFELNPKLPITAGIDFGRRFPAVVFLQSVQRRLADGRVATLDVVFDELQVDEVLTPELVRLIRRTGYTLDGAAVDPAGNATNVHSGLSDIQLLQRPVDYAHDPYGGGLGCPVLAITDAAKREVTAGIARVEALMCSADGIRRLVVAEDLWQRGKDAPPGQRTLYKSLLRYSWDHVRRKRHGQLGDDDPTHACDAVREWVKGYRWDVTPVLPAMTVLTSEAVDAGWEAFVGGER